MEMYNLLYKVHELIERHMHKKDLIMDMAVRLAAVVSLPS